MRDFAILRARNINKADIMKGEGNKRLELKYLVIATLAVILLVTVSLFSYIVKDDDKQDFYSSNKRSASYNRNRSKCELKKLCRTFGENRGRCVGGNYFDRCMSIILTEAEFSKTKACTPEGDISPEVTDVPNVLQCMLVEFLDR